MPLDPMRYHEFDPALLVEALKAMTADAVVTVTHLQPRAVAYRRGLTGPKETWVGESALIWNSWEWRWE